MTKIKCLVVAIALLWMGTLLAQDLPCDVYIRSAKIYLNRTQPDYESALKNLEAGYKKCYDDPVLHELLGRVYADQDKLDKMTEEFKIAREKGSLSSEDIRKVIESKWVSEFQEGTKDLDQADKAKVDTIRTKAHKLAVQHFDNCIRLDSSRYQPYVNAAAIRIDLNELEKADTLLSKAYQLIFPGLNQVLNYSIDVTNVKSPDKVKEIWQKIESTAGQKETYVKLADTYSKKGEKERSTEGWDLITHVAVSALLSQTKQTELAKTVLDKGSDLLSKQLNVVLNYGINLYNLQKYDQAIELFQQAAKIDPNNRDALVNLASLYGQKGDKEKSMQMWDLLIEKGMGDKDVYYNRGLLYLVDAQEVTKQISALEDSAAKNPKNESLKRELDNSKTKKNEILKKAQSDFNQSVQLDSLDVEALYHLGFVYLLESDWNQAQTSLEKVKSLKPDHKDAWEALVIVYTRQGMIDKAKEADAKSRNL